MKNASANTHATKPIARYKSSCFPPGLGGTRYLVFVVVFFLLKVVVVVVFCVVVISKSQQQKVPLVSSITVVSSEFTTGKNPKE